MRKRNLLICLIATVVACMIMTGCVQETSTTQLSNDEATALPQPTPTPTPPPKEGLEAVFGKDEITIALISNADETASELFFQGAQKEAQSLGVTLKTIAAEERFNAEISEMAKNEIDAIITYAAEPQTNYVSLVNATDNGIPVCVFEINKTDIPYNVSHIYYNPDDAISMAFNAALTFPPHDTPVRLILMFESRETEAYAAFEKLFTEGKIFPKEIYIATEDESGAPDEWLTKTLDNYIEGMLDGIFAENAELGIGAVDALEALERTDMEVFGIDLSADVVTCMSNNPDVFAQAVGPNTALAGILSVRIALAALNSDDIISLELTPSLVSAADLNGDISGALAGMDDSLISLYNEDWMDVLRDYYGD